MFLFVFEVSGVQVKLCFSFFAVICLTCLLGSESGEMLIMLGCCALHELGHVAAMLLCSCKPTEVTFYGGGIRLGAPRRINSFAQDVFILASGCAVNFLLAFAGCITAGRLTFFVQTNLLLGGFNLLPIGFLDGGKLIDLLLSPNKAKAVKAVFAALVAALAVTAMLCGGVSPSLLCVLGFMVVSIFAA